MAELTPEFTQALCGAYADFLRRQRIGGIGALSDWPIPNLRRAPEFVWLGGDAETRERLMSGFQDLGIGAGHPALASIKKMSATITLNPYEREAIYGYPFVIGKQGNRAIRAPLLMVPVIISPEGRGFVITPTEERAEFNPFPFLSDTSTEARELSLSRLVQDLPQLPISLQALQRFVDSLQREIEGLEVAGNLDGRLSAEPERPRGPRRYLSVIDQAAVLIAPQSSYFLVSDLQKLSKEATATRLSCLGPLLAGAGHEDQVDITSDMEAKAKIFFPFPSNRAQRNVAILLNDPSTRVIRVDGPPGTGKSVTIANLVCHLVAEGKNVLVTSQKDKALQVVHEKLSALGNPLLPMTLLHRDKKPLLERLASIRKERARVEIDQELANSTKLFEESRKRYHVLHQELTRATDLEQRLFDADQDFESKRGFARFLAKFKHKRMWNAADQAFPERSDAVSQLATDMRKKLDALATDSLRLASEARTASETRAERGNREELSKVVRRNQTSYRNYSLFDRLKQDTERAKMLLRSLPAWIMTPDDVARLFPCQEGAFDVVIVDEASQVDLPSIAPILYRGKKIVIFGDARQMQPKRFAFTRDNVARAAWQKFDMRRFDPDEFLYPTKQSLLELAQTRAEETVFLNEHFRCLPSIIGFSNDRWYGSRMRIMTDETLKQFGSPDTPAITLRHVAGLVTSGTQVNELEARALVDLLKNMLSAPEYKDASFAVLCLFLEQMEYVQHLVEDEIAQDTWREHNLVVLNPDGMQGDERDVILYSLSYDSKNMTRQQLTPRLHDQPHIQGMLNVAFTRPRHEVQIFHSAPIEEFAFSGGRPSALSAWLAHGRHVMEIGRLRRVADRGGKVDSLFEVDVAEVLRQRGFTVTHQYPACGFWIDLVVEHQTRPRLRLAVECDGDVWHHDEHGGQKLGDLEREEILARAGWHVLRIPYSGWKRASEAQVNRVATYFFPDEPSEPNEDEGASHPSREIYEATQNHIVGGIKSGLHAERDVAKYVATKMGFDRLGTRITDAVKNAAEQMVANGLVVLEDGEWYLTEEGRGVAPVDR